MATIQAKFRMYGVAGGYGYLGHRKGRFPSSNDIASGSTFYNEHGNLSIGTISWVIRGIDWILKTPWNCTNY